MQDACPPNSTCALTTSHYDSPMVCRVSKWLRQLFPDEELRDFFWRYLSSILCSVRLLQKALGEYCVKLPACMLSKKEGHSTAANPCKAMASNSKLVVFDEPEDSDQLRSALIKSLSGGDVYFNRNLYDKGSHHNVTFKMLMVYNRVPPIRNPDTAVRRRFVVLPFESVWVDNPPSSEEEQYETRRFQKDNRFDQRLDYLAPGLPVADVQTVVGLRGEGTHREAGCSCQGHRSLLQRE